MAIYNAPASPRTLGYSSLGLGLLGLVFWWWVPFGMVLALAGLVVGFIGWVLTGRRTAAPGVVLAGLFVSAAALAFDLFIAANGLGTLWIKSLQ
jgi:hypothetical protein